MEKDFISETKKIVKDLGSIVFESNYQTNTKIGTLDNILQDQKQYIRKLEYIFEAYVEEHKTYKKTINFLAGKVSQLEMKITEMEGVLYEKN